MKVPAAVKERDEVDVPKDEYAADFELRQITQKLLAALIENEINSAFVFAAFGRAAYQAGEILDGDNALAKVEAIYGQASELARDVYGPAREAIADRLRELRLAIDTMTRETQK